MSLINVTNVEILDNPTKFTNPFQFEITFECLPPGVQEGESTRAQRRWTQPLECRGTLSLTAVELTI